MIYLFDSRLGFACPISHNPADFFINLLSVNENKDAILDGLDKSKSEWQHDLNHFDHQDDFNFNGIQQ